MLPYASGHVSYNSIICVMSSNFFQKKFECSNIQHRPSRRFYTKNLLVVTFIPHKESFGILKTISFYDLSSMLILIVYLKP